MATQYILGDFVMLMYIHCI